MYYLNVLNILYSFLLREVENKSNQICERYMKMNVQLNLAKPHFEIFQSRTQFFFMKQGSYNPSPNVTGIRFSLFCAS